MPKGPKGEKRPADVIGNAVKSMRILTGDEAEERSHPAKKAAGIKGGKSRADKLTEKERSSAASKAARARWKRD